MNNDLYIYIIEDDIDACYSFKEQIETTRDICLVGMTDDTEKALVDMTLLNPHVVILDLELSVGYGNGLSFLHSLNKLVLPFKPFILITTNNSSQIIYSHARKSGADFILYKHQKDYSEKMVIDFLQSMKTDLISNSLPLRSITQNNTANQEKRPILGINIERELLKIGISPKAKGFNYLCEGIMYYLDDPSKITKRLAIRHKKSEPSIERAMQNAINKAWTIGNTEHLYQNYTAVIRSDKGVPTLLEFISYYAIQLRDGT